MPAGRNISISSGATFVINTTTLQIFEGTFSGGGTVIIPTNVTVYLVGAGNTVAPLSLVLSNGATLDANNATTTADAGTQASRR